MMNIQKTVFTVIFLAITLITFAQSPVYQVKKVDGKEYLLYPVQSGEGLYGIARRFNTTIKILNDLNPDAANGLKTGQIILIPFNRQEISAKVSQPKVEEPKTEEKKEDRNTNFMDQWEIPKEIVVTAWYSPDIPINQGPENYWGLPGLILEVSDGKTVILCSKIVINPKEKKEIKAPKKGKLVTQSEYDKIVADKMEEWREMGRQGGGSFRMGR